MNMEIPRWSELLGSWQREVKAIHDRQKSAWNSLDLPNIDDLAIRCPDKQRFSHFFDASLCRKPGQIESFYQTTDGWPLWLGSSKIEIARVRMVDIFKTKYPSAFRDSVEPYLQFESEELEYFKEMGDLLVLSEPDARDFVLLKKDGSIILQQFDDQTEFSSFWDFMNWAKQRVTRVLKEML